MAEFLGRAQSLLIKFRFSDVSVAFDYHDLRRRYLTLLKPNILRMIGSLMKGAFDVRHHLYEHGRSTCR